MGLLLGQKVLVDDDSTLDNISVSAVPEAGAFALGGLLCVLLVLAGLIFGCRRRSAAVGLSRLGCG